MKQVILYFAGLLTLAATTARSAETNLLQIASLGTSISPGPVEVVGPLAYVADTKYGLRIIDIANVDKAREVGSLRLPGEITDLDAAGAFVYVTTIAPSVPLLRIIDVRNPAAPVLVGVFETNDCARAVEVVGGLAYLGTCTGLRILDVQNPREPRQLRRYVTSQDIVSLAVVGNVAYAVESDFLPPWNLHIINVSNPDTSNPTRLGVVELANSAHDVKVSGNRAYIANGSDGLSVVDVSNPAAPLLATTVPTLDRALGVAVQDGRAYVADLNPGVVVVDLATEAIVTSIDTGAALHIALAGNHAFISDSFRGLVILNKALPTQLTRAGGIFAPDPFPVVEIRGDIAFLGDSTLGLRVIDVADPSTLRQVGQLYGPNAPLADSFLNPFFSIRDLKASGRWLYVSTLSSIRIVDLLNPANPIEVGRIPTRFAETMDVAGTILYVADSSDGLKIFDVADPAQVRQLGQYQTPGFANSLRVRGGRAYVGYGGGILPGLDKAGVDIVDVSTSASPRHLHTIDTTSGSVPNGAVESLDLAGDYLYFLASGFGLLIYDLPEQGTPQEVGRLGSSEVGFAQKLVVEGDLAFLSDFAAASSVVNVSNPAAPFVTETLLGRIAESRVQGQFAFLADRETLGLRILALSGSLPYITSQPQPAVVPVGQDTAFGVVATSFAPLTYQWLKDWQTLAGATNSVLTLTNVQLADAANYAVRVSTTNGTVTSDPVLLTVFVPVAPPTIVQHPASTNLGVSADLVLNVVVQGGAPLFYQWLKNGVALSDGLRLTGSSSSTLALSSVTLADAGVYSVVVSNSAGLASSQGALVEVTDPACLVLSENFEDGLLDPRIVITTAGSFSAPSGIKNFSNFGSTRAFGFGRSSCSMNCFDSFTTTLTISLAAPTYLSAISFKEMELFGNSGSKGTIRTNGVEMNGIVLGRTPPNDGQPDSSFRLHQFIIDGVVSNVTIYVSDITSASEIAIDDLNLSGRCQRISIADAAVPESQGQAQFGVTLSSPNTAVVTVHYSVTGISATELLDYGPAEGELSFAPGQTNQVVVVGIISDLQFEGDETFVVTLSEPMNAVLFDDQALGVILNDDPSPDVAVINIQAPPNVMAGQTVQISWTLTNVGTTAIEGTWADAVFFSPNDQVGGSDFSAGEYAIATPFPPRTVITRVQDVLVPPQLSGDWWVEVEANANGGFAELNRANNRNRSPSPIHVAAAPFPNLQVVSVVGPSRAFAKQETEVEWVVINAGPETTMGLGWSDSVWLSQDPELDSSDLLLGSTKNPSSLAPGQSYSSRMAVTLPGRLQGLFYYLVRTDAGSHIFEGGLENDNAASSVASQVILPPVPDLQVSFVRGPAVAGTGEPYTLSWAVTNAGPGDTEDALWYDRVLLSLDAVLSFDDIPLQAVRRDGVLKAAAAYTNAPTVLIPVDLPPTNYYFLVDADYSDLAWEYVYEGNNSRATALPVNIVQSPPPDLEIDAHTVPPNAGAGFTVPVSFRVNNNGSIVTPNHSWRDAVFLSQDDKFDPGIDPLLITTLRSGQLQNFDGYTVNVSVPLPRHLGGDYFLIMVADYQRTVFELDRLNNIEISASRLHIATLSDLRASRVTASPTGRAGFPLQVTFGITNAGASPTLGSAWNDGLYLSPDGFLNQNSIPLGPVTRGLSLAPDAFYETNASVDIPIGVSGDFFLFAVADAGNQVPEVNEGNNAVRSLGTVRVDLAANDLRGGQVAIPPATVAGFDLVFSYTGMNAGADPIPNASWSDKIYLSLNQTFETNDVPLGMSGATNPGPNASYTNHLTLRVPERLSGDYYVLVVLDANAAVFEQLEANNVVSSPAPLHIISQPPDLIPSGCQTTNFVIAGNAIDVQWTVANQGTGPTSTDAWLDALILSRDAVLGNSDDVQLALVPHTGALAVGANYPAVRRATIPVSTAAGGYRIFVVADHRNDIYEAAAENNNQCLTLQVTVVPPDVDLIIPDVLTETNAASGQALFVAWTGRNLGNSGTVSSWVDSIYLSATPALTPESLLLGTHLHVSSLAGGASYAASNSFELPWDVAGAFFVVVVADGTNRIAETSESNNVATASTPVSIDLSPTPDLFLSGVKAPTRVGAGQEISVSWNGRNTGAATTRSWYDAVYLSLDAILDRSTDVFLGYVERQGGLSQAGRYSVTNKFQLPANLQGSFRLFVVIDSTDRIYERQAEHNNQSLSGVMLVDGPVIADLVVKRVDPSNPVEVGQLLTSSYTLVNQSSNAVNGTWQDAIFLSRDERWDVTDTLLTRVDLQLGLGSFQAHTQSFTAVVPGLLPGVYFLVARCDVLNRVVESDNDNNDGFSLAPILVTMRELALGQCETNVFTNKAEHFYRVQVPAQEALALTLDSTSTDGINELFASYGQVPSRAAFDFVYANPSAPDQRIVVPDTQMGYYYNLARGQHVPDSPAPYRFCADIIPFGITLVSPARIGDQGQITLTLHGARFRDGAVVHLRKNGLSIGATTVSVTDGTMARATFNLSGLEHGDYEVVLTNPDQRVAVAPALVLVEDATSFRALLTASGETQPRVGRPMTTEVLVQNGGNIDLPATLISAAFGTDGSLAFRFPDQRSVSQSAPNVQFINGATVGAFTIPSLAPGETFAFAMTLTEFDAGPFRALLEAREATGPQGAPDEQDLRTTHLQFLGLDNANCPGGSQWSPTSPLTDADLTACVEPIRPVDPNEKVGPEAYGAERFIPAQGDHLFTVLFENISNATASAQQIVIVDQLPAALDPRTVRFQAIAFHTNVIEVPGNRSFFQARVVISVSNNLAADVFASVDISARTIRWTLTTIDLSTGEAPLDPTAGLLPPNDSTHRGEGFVSYKVKTSPTAITGHVSTNRATIAFDRNEPIDTNPVLNTIDAAPPDSMAMAAAIAPTPRFNVGWVGVDDLRGSGVRDFDIYVSDNGAAFELWLAGTTATSSEYPGQVGHRYRFYSRARDNAGNREAAPADVDAEVLVTTNTAPELTQIADQATGVGRIMAITNTVTDANGPDARHMFALINSPAGAWIDTNGVVRWLPACEQAGITYPITVVVCDAGPDVSLCRTQSFNVTVGDCLNIRLGDAVVAAGGVTNVALDLITTAPLTNLTLRMHYPEALLTGWVHTALHPDLLPPTYEGNISNQLAVTFNTRPGLVLLGTNRLADLQFGAAPAQPSVIIPLNLTHMSGRTVLGTNLTDVIGDPGRVVVIGEFPILEAHRNRAGERLLTLYGMPGVEYNLVFKTNMVESIWQHTQVLRLDNMSLTIPALSSNQAPTIFYGIGR